MKCPDLKGLAAALTLFAAGMTSGHAAPMGFKGSWMAMGDIGPNWREAYANYAVTPRDAFGVETIYMRSDDLTKTRQLEEATYTCLLRRWNLKNAQANLWFIGGIGTMRLYDDGVAASRTATMATPGMQFDYETTRVYFAVTERLFRGRSVNHDFSSLRAGFSLYETDYDETQPWFILEARRMHDLSEKTEVTPMLRLINKNYFIEAGINTARQMRFNFMYIF